MGMRLPSTGREPSKSTPLTPSEGSISVFIAYPDRYKDQPAPDWAARAFHEDEVPARVALNAVRTGEPTEYLREIGPNGWWGAWWAVEIRIRRSKGGNPKPSQHQQADDGREGAAKAGA